MVLLYNKISKIYDITTLRYNMEHQIPQRSPYHQSPMSEEMYHRERSYAEMTESMSGGIARPTVTYSNEIVSRPYDSGLINSAGHRPYDPGTNSFERYPR